MKFSSKLKSYRREFKLLAKGLLFTDHPVLAHVIVTRRCNLACGYCNEYDDSSLPVPLELMNRRIDKLVEAGTTAIVLSGGEPLLHPGLEEIIVRIRKHGMLAGLISNCYLLTPKRIQALNQAGLEYLQISIDNVKPNEVSNKSLKVLDQKLVWLSRMADFKVNVNSVIGVSRTPEDALVVGQRAVELGFSCSLGIIHDGHGSLKPLAGIGREVYLKMKRLGKKGYTRINGFQHNLAHGRPNEWRCRAGARYLYICEDGLVHYCSQQRGCPGVPLESYTKADIRREYRTKKECADFCTISCVHQVSALDAWRDPQTLIAERAAPSSEAASNQVLHQIELEEAS